MAQAKLDMATIEIEKMKLKLKADVDRDSRLTKILRRNIGKYGKKVSV